MTRQVHLGKDLVEGRVPREKIAGSSFWSAPRRSASTTSRRRRSTPPCRASEVHAQILESALTKATLNRPGSTALAEIGIAVLVGLALVAMAPVVSAGGLFLLGGVVAALILGLSWHYFSSLRILVDYSFPLGSSFLIYITLVFTNYLQASADRRRIRSAFSQYLSPALVNELAQSPEKLKLGGERRDMTILFSDVRGFTTISEQYKSDPQGLTALMNRLLTPLTNVIIERKGTIDKYMGDAIMAFWNAPLDDAAHALNACDAALTMIDALEALNQEREREAERQGCASCP
jgi:adenylate cyclase